MPYQHFSIEEREQIQELLWQKISIRNIARVIGRSPSSVLREIQRNESKIVRRYTPRVAQARALLHRTKRGQRKLEKNAVLRSHVVSHLKLGWSPEQIAATAKSVRGLAISHEAIYQYVYAQAYRNGWGNIKPGCEDLRLYLARQRKRRMKKGFRQSRRLKNGLLPSIDNRPREVASRIKVGHWEDDSLVYAPTCPVRLRTLNERVSGVVFLEKAHDRTKMEANRITKKRLGRLPWHLRQTLTRDRGPENLGHEELERDLGIRCFFAHAYHAWERGSNENINGLVRRFFPKHTDFRTITTDDLRRVEYLLNSRPRKRLGWKTPSQVFYELTGVALRG